MTNRYATAWESYWSDVPAIVGAATWDSGPELIAALDRPIFERYFDPALPILDFGCGNGTQTRYLSELYPQVIGVDHSTAALAIAGKINSAPNIEYRHLDVLEPTQTAALHEEAGDLNVYLRAVLHQFDAGDRRTAVSALATLAGTRGHVFASELSPAAKALVTRLVSQPGGPPPKVAQVLRHGVTPAELEEGELRKLFSEAGFELLTSGERMETYTECLSDGSRLEVPYEYLVARRLSGKN